MRRKTECHPATEHESVSLVVCAYNEQHNVVPVLEELIAWLTAHEPGAEILFVDDGSTDGTPEIAEAALAGANARVVRHDNNRGIGAAIKTGVRAASNPWVTFMPADGQIDPEGIATLRSTAAKDGTSLVLSVYEDRDDGKLRKLLSWGVRAMIRVVHGVKLDCDGPYLFRREMFDADVLEADSFFLNFEFPIRMLREGCDVSVAQIRCRPRLSGASKTANLGTIAKVASNLVGLRIRLWRAG